MPWNPDNNPYNFVPFGPPVRLSEVVPTHRHFSGLTGTITLHLTNDTPFLVAQRVSGDEERPPRLENVKINGRLVIPGTSLKGMVRGVLEAITNSCFSIFDGAPLDYRIATQDALKLRPGRIVKMPDGKQDGQVEEMEKAWVSMAHAPAIKVKQNGNEITINLFKVPPGAKSGQKVWVSGRAVEEYFSNTRHARGKNPWIKAQTGTFAMVEDISPTPKTGYIEGVYKITGKSIGIKKRERVFAPKKGVANYPFSMEELKSYNRILEGQLAEHDKRKDFDLTETEPLKVGSLVYFDLSGGKAVRLSRVEIPRIPYQHSRGDRLPQEYHACSDPKDLCTACRLFGFIADLNGLKGRVTFSDADRLTGPGELDRFLHLRVLGEPHPTSCNFYLRDPRDSTQVRNYDGLKITDGRGRTEGPAGEVELRGRKFYWHQMKTWQEYEIPPNRRQQFNRVRVLAKPLQPNNVFKFQVNFRNLSEAELGLLLYSLVLEEPLRHKLGLAKALGFGTVKVTCQTLTFCQTESRYTSLGAAPQNQTRDVDTYLGAFKNAVQAATGQDFDQLLNVTKLKKILDPSQAPPQVGYFFDPAGREEGFQWYSHNKDKPLGEL